MKMFMNGCKAYSAENLNESAKLAEIQRENNSVGMCKGIIFANKKEKIKIPKKGRCVRKWQGSLDK